MTFAVKKSFLRPGAQKEVWNQKHGSKTQLPVFPSPYAAVLTWIQTAQICTSVLKASMLPALPTTKVLRQVDSDNSYFDSARTMANGAAKVAGDGR